MRLLFDTESNGFVSNATKLHCIGITDVETGDYTGYRPHEIGAAVKRMHKADELIGHNIQRHDIPLLTKLTQWKPRPEVIIRDTMVMARLIFPNVKATDQKLIDAGKMPGGKDYKGKHTIAAWGYRLGCPKGDYAKVKEAEARAQGITDPHAIIAYVWGTFNEDMFSYMGQDCETNFELWKHLNPDKYSQPALQLEHDVAEVCNSMEMYGVPFDLTAAGRLQADLTERKHQLGSKLKAEYGFWYQPVSPDPTKALFTPKKGNKPSVWRYDAKNDQWGWSTPGYWGPSTEDWAYDDIKHPDHPKHHASGKQRVVNGYPCTKLKLVEFNPGSRDHIARVLKLRGWVPTKLTDGGKPQIDEEVIESIVARYPEMDGLGDLMMIDKRLSQLCGTDNSLMASVKDTGCVHGVINPMGTITSRGAHMFPNLGQVPSAKKPYGKDFRGLFMCGPAMPHGWVALGADQEGLELRGLAHYLAKLDGGKYAQIVCHGDPHWLHAQVMGLAEEVERDKHNKLHTIVREDGSKRFIYAYIYGCWDDMAGSILYECLLNAKRNGGPEGEALYAKFFGGPASSGRGELAMGLREGAPHMPPTEKALRRVGKNARDAFLTRIEGFGKLKELIAEQIERKGRIVGLDNRIIPVRSDHSALNFMIQSAGAIICKRWLVDAFKECCAKFKLGWDGDFVFCLWVHDEIQVCCRKEVAKEIGEILVRCAKKAGEPYGFRVPLDSKYVIGASWADTH